MFIVTGSADQIMEVLAGPRQHNEHCNAWRWNAYLSDAKLRAANVREEALKIIARRQRLDGVFLEAAE